ncbi:MAG: hypothetical protein R3267_06050 [Paenisporosarcina sp.]|nr:hypothetical protein [Paenisporosarcina sp.]
MNLVTIEKQLSEFNKDRVNLRNEFEQQNKYLNTKIADLERLKNMGLNNFDLNKIFIAETILEFSNGFKRKHKNVIQTAINDVVNNFNLMRKEYFGIKDYSGFVGQEVQCHYGYGPKHGYVVFSIGIKKDVRQKEITEEEQDACVYYLNHLKDNEDFFVPFNYK